MRCSFFHRRGAQALFLLGLLAARVALAGDYNLRLVTDGTPDLTDIESYVRSITAGFAEPEDRAIAVWRWGRRCRHQTRCATDRGRLIWDPVLHFNSYGYMNCGIISALNIAVAMQAGFQGRYIQLGDHTVSELSWDGGESWHLFDSSMSIFCRDHQGLIASCEEIKGAAACERSGGRSEPGHFYLYHPDPACASHLGPTGWRCASDNPVEFQRTLEAGVSSYTSGYDVSRYSQMAQWGRRYILNLVPYQTYTRYWRLLETDSAHLRPAAGEKDANNPAKNAITRTVRANGVWEFRPDLSSPDWKSFVHDDENLDVRSTRPHFAPHTPGRICRAVFKVDAANVITSMRIDANVVCAGAGSAVRLLVSRDAGLAWKDVWSATDAGGEKLALELEDEVAGHTEALVRFDMLTRKAGDRCGLDSLAITTVTQVNRLTLPRLHRGPNRVQLRLGEQERSLVLWPVLHGGAYRETAFEAKDIFSLDAADSFYKATIGAGANNTPCRVVWRLPAPTDITGVTVGARVCNRGSGYVSLQCSWDGEEYHELFRKSDGEAPFDLMVLKTVKAPTGTRAAWVRCEFFTPRAANTYNAPGIQDIFVRVAHRPREVTFRPVEVTYAWTEHHREGDVARRLVQVVRSPEEEWQMHVGGYRDPKMDWVRVRLHDGESESAPETSPLRGDGTARELAPQRVLYRWGHDLARGAPYTASRPACAANGDEGGRELTDGTVVAPTDYFTSSWPPLLHKATAGWDGEVRFDVDLGRVVTVGGVRTATHQPNERYCHPLRVEVSLSPDGGSWRRVGEIHHDDLWTPPGDYEPWEYDDDPRFAGLPAGGRLAYPFPLLWEPAPARYVRFHFFPLPDRGIGISELQVFDRVEVSAWPGEITLSPLGRKSTAE